MQPKAYHTLLEFSSEPAEIHSVGGHSLLCTTIELNNPQLVTLGGGCRQKTVEFRILACKKQWVYSTPEVSFQGFFCPLLFKTAKKRWTKDISCPRSHFHRHCNLHNKNTLASLFTLWQSYHSGLMAWSSWPSNTHPSACAETLYLSACLSLSCCSTMHSGFGFYLSWTTRCRHGPLFSLAHTVSREGGALNSKPGTYIDPAHTPAQLVCLFSAKSSLDCHLRTWYNLTLPQGSAQVWPLQDVIPKNQTENWLHSNVSASVPWCGQF